MFSIITATFNKEEYLKQLILSVEAQTFTNWELIIFDDGSKDNTLKIAKEFANKNPKIKVFCHPDNKNLGLAKTLQKALQLAKGKYIAFLENDDYWHPDYLKEKIKILNDDGNLIVINKPSLVGNKERVKKLKIYYSFVYFYCKSINGFKKIWNLNKCFITFNPVFGFSGICAKREFFENLNFETPFAPWLDRWLLLQLSFKYKFYFVDKELTFWRLSKNSWTMKSQKDLAKGSKKFKEEALRLYKQKLSAFSFLVLKIKELFDTGFYYLLLIPAKFLINKILRLF